MIDNLLSDGDCMCPACQRMRQMRKDNPNLPWADPHKYDYLHAEERSDWTFKPFCRCGLCREERQQQQVKA